MSSLDYIVIVLGVALGITFVLVILPRIAIRRLPAAQLTSITDPKDRLSVENDRLKLRNEFRTTCVSFVGGLILIAGLLVSFQQFQSSQQALANSIQSSREQLDIARLTARNQQYVENVKNLGDSSATVRVAAVEALYDIAQLGETERDEAVSILSAHIEQRATWPPPSGDPYPANADPSAIPPLDARHPDVNIALARLGQGNLAQSKDIPLSQEDLRGANMQRTDYSGRYFIDVHMASSLLRNVNFAGATFVRTDLSGSDLTGAKLCGAWLGTANLSGATMEGVIADDRTTWPAGFDYAAAGVINAKGGDCS